MCQVSVWGILLNNWCACTALYMVSEGGRPVCGEIFYRTRGYTGVPTGKWGGGGLLFFSVSDCVQRVVMLARYQR
jgi:hypothetical protein